MHRLLLPGLVLGLALGYDLAGDGDGPSWLVPASRVTFAVVFLLAWRLRRGRVAWSVLALAATAEALRLELAEAPLAALLLTVSVLLPLDLGAAALLREWWVASAGGLVRLGVLGAEAVVVHAAVHDPAADWVTALRDFGTAGGGDGGGERGAQVWTATAGVVGRAVDLAGLPSTATLLAFAVAAVAAAWAFARRRTALEAGLLGALVAVALAFGRPDAGLYLGAGGLVLGLALVETAFALAFHDGLTGLPARRALEEQLRQLGRVYAVAMVDLDHFKKLNDRHGHEVGDQVLRMVAARLEKVSGGGRAFRYGGEEFTVVFPGRSAAAAEAHLEALRRDVAGRPFTVRSPGRPKRKPRHPLDRPKAVTKKLKVTVSIGVAGRDDANATPERVLKAADRALYRSKQAGRNRVTAGS